MWWFDLISHNWRDIKIVRNSLNRWLEEGENKYVNFESDEGPGPLYHHRWAPVFYSQRDESWEKYIYEHNWEDDSDEDIIDPLIKQPNIEWHKVDHYLKQEGIYFFGGKSLLGIISNEVWWLKLWDRVQAKIAEEIDENYRK